MKAAGEVVELWRYPVKSMLGERRERLRFDLRGASGDRLFAVRDADGKLGSGKSTRRFVKMDGLLSLRASRHYGISRVHFPGGRVIGTDSPFIGEALSSFLGRPVSLVREKEISHLDAGPVHLLSLGSLEELGRCAPEGAVDVRRFRPNVVLSMSSSWRERNRPGSRLRIGEVELEVTCGTERCAMVASAQAGLKAAPGVLRHVADRFDLEFGVYAEVRRVGTIRVGDVVEASGSPMETAG